MAIIKTSKASYAGSTPIASSVKGGTVYQAPTGQKSVQPVAPRTAYNQAYSGGQVLGTTTGGGSTPAPITGGQDYSSAPMESTPSQDDGGFNFDSIINPVLESLGQTEAEAQSLFGLQQGDIEAGKQTSRNRLESTQKTQKGLLETGATRQKQEGESAADEARRQFAEVQQGLQGLYGGTTGTGAFATELAGRDTFGRIADIRQTVSGALRDIDDKKVQIEELGRIALEDIDNDARSQITQAREQLNSTLASVRGQRGELSSRKAEMAMQAMQNFRALKSEVEARNTAFKQQLFMKQQDAQQRLAQAQSKAQSIAESFKLYNAKDMAGNSQPVQVGNKGSILDVYGQPTEFKPQALYGVGGTIPTEEDSGDALDSRLKELGL